ncbi:hypothetical protein BLOT_010235 [Blomia tropicalis]|nr:hypothetical protein BLOT_010235 [Blomia tropicalis]
MADDQNENPKTPMEAQMVENFKNRRTTIRSRITKVFHRQFQEPNNDLFSAIDQLSVLEYLIRQYERDLSTHQVPAGVNLNLVEGEWQGHLNQMRGFIARVRILPPVDEEEENSRRIVNQPLNDISSKFDLKELKYVQPFDGKSTEFHNFWAEFETVVDHTDIPPIKKLMFLREKLSGEAKERIKCYRGDRYEEAKEALKGYYQDDYKIRMDVLAEFQRTPKVTHEYHWESLRLLLNAVAVAQASLENLTDDATSLQHMKSLIHEKLPLSVCAKSPFGTKRDATLEEFLEFLKEYVDTVGRIEEQGRFGGRMEWNGAGPKQHRQITPTNGYERNVHCDFCGDRHRTYNCNYEMSPDARMSIVKNKRLCMRCLRHGHKARDCESTYTCNYCSQSHSTLICTHPRRHTQSEVPE